MKFINKPVRYFFSSQEKRIHTLREAPSQMQEKWFRYLIAHGADTVFGKGHGLTKDASYNDFRKAIPLQNYPSLTPYIERVIKGESNVLWDTKIKFLAKSSGTTDSKSKFIPVSNESLKYNNYLAAMDSLTFYCNFFPENNFFSGKALALGGSFQKMPPDSPVKIGDVSAILLDEMPRLGDFLKASNREVLLHDDWNVKLGLLAKTSYKQNVTSLSGVPSWILLVLKEVLRISGKSNIFEVWPNLEVFFHGGVSFAPYVEEYKKIIPEGRLFYMNMYNASEGFFGFQDQKEKDDLILLTDHGIFYEFIPMNEVGVLNQDPVSLEEVQTGVNYALVITTTAGLWRYVIGDTVMFTSTSPYRFKITGRTMHYINAFGEELVVDNADKALKKACEKTGASFSDYTAAPVFLESEQNKACHEWLIEFITLPSDMDEFVRILDSSLKELNSDYEAKRTGDLILKLPMVHIAPQDTFLKWLDRKNHLGGQHKVPRLQNDRRIIEELLQLISRSSL